MYSIPDVGPLLTIADFEPHLGTDFLVDATPKPLKVRLDAILRGTENPTVWRQPFTLVFTTPRSDLLLEGVYRMQPHGGRQVEVYLCPTQSSPGPLRFYHAMFN